MEQNPKVISLRDKLKTLSERTRLDGEPIIPKRVTDTINYWNNLNLKLQVHGSVHYAKSVRTLKSLFRGTLFNKTTNLSKYHNLKFEPEIVMGAFDLFNESVHNLDYEPTDKSVIKQYHLYQFVYNPFNKYLPSNLTYILDVGLRQSTPNIYPNIRNSLLKQYRETFTDSDNKFSGIQMVCFTKGANNLGSFYNKNKSKIRLMNLSPEKLVKTFIEFLKTVHTPNFLVSPKLLSYDAWVFEKFYGYLRARNLI